MKSDEYFNVGIWLQDESRHNISTIFIDSHKKHLEALLGFLPMARDCLLVFLENMKKETSIETWHNNRLHLSKEYFLASNTDIQKTADTLYREHIGYKFA